LHYSMHQTAAPHRTQAPYAYVVSVCNDHKAHVILLQHVQQVICFVFGPSHAGQGWIPADHVQPLLPIIAVQRHLTATSRLTEDRLSLALQRNVHCMHLCLRPEHIKQALTDVHGQLLRHLRPLSASRPDHQSRHKFDSTCFIYGDGIFAAAFQVQHTSKTVLYMQLPWLVLPFCDTFLLYFAKG